MDIYLLAINFIVADKLLGGIPSKVVEHIIINNAMALTWWGATNILYGAGYLAMLPFTKVEVPLHYSLLDAAMCNEYIIEHKYISDTVESKILLHPNMERLGDTKTETTQPIIEPSDIETCQSPVAKSPELHEWEVINKDENKVILTNNKDSKLVIITKKEVDDMIIINKE